MLDLPRQAEIKRSTIAVEASHGVQYQHQDDRASGSENIVSQTRRDAHSRGGPNRRGGGKANDVRSLVASMKER
jgi:hypothetical protein